MRAVLHVSKFYSWEPIPPDTKVTPADISSERVRVAANGGYAMRVTRQQASHTTVLMPEADVVGKIIHERTRPSGGRVLTRKQAIAFALGEDVLPPGWPVPLPGRPLLPALPPLMVCMSEIGS